jgi:CheY-like chemotaxis protein
MKMAKILIVDDRPINRQYLVSLLGPFGHQLLEAEDGAEALLLADREHPDLVITDLHMPNADGPEFIRVLRRTPTGRTTPVIVYTATQDTMTAREMVRDCGAFDVLVKPTEPAELLAVVSRALCAAAPLPAGRKPLPQCVPSAGTQLPPKVESATGEHRLAALVELILDLTEATDPEPLLKTFCHRCRSLIHAGSAAVIILDDRGEKVSHAVTSGFSADESATAKCDRLSLESPLISPVLRRHTLRLRNVKATD